VIVLSTLSFATGCASKGSEKTFRGEVVDSRSALGYTGDPHYFVTVECREGNGALSRLTFEVNREDWMRFHPGGEEICLIPSFGSLRLARCN
jgi:hypothetical protein